MRHQLPRPEMSPSTTASGVGTSTNSMAGGNSNNLPGTSSSSSEVADGGSTSTSSSSVPMGPPPTASPIRGGSKPHSVIRTLRQMSMEDSANRRSSYASPTSASTNSLIASLEAVHNSEMESVENPANIVRHIVEEFGSIIKDMRADTDTNQQNPGAASGGFVEDLTNCSDVGVLRQRLMTVERANHMMTIHLDLMDLQKKLEKAEALKLDDRKSFVIATREELYKEIVELLEAEFSCSICNEVFVSPCVTKCGHTFCELCIKTWTRDKVDCPICRNMIFSDWGKNCEIDNFITRLHLRLSDEIRQSREALVQERVQAVETLRTTPRRNSEGVAFVDALRFIREQQQQGRTASPTTARALAERFRAMRRSAADANMGSIDELMAGPTTAPSTNEGGTIGRIRARLQQELQQQRQNQQQSVEPVNSLSQLSRPGSSGGRQASPSVARIRVRPSPGVSFTLVAPRSMISSQQTSSPVASPAPPNQTMTVRTQITEPPQPATTVDDTTPNRDSQPAVSAASVNEQLGRRVPLGLLMTRGYTRSQQTGRFGLERAVANIRSQLSTRSPSTETGCATFTSSPASPSPPLPANDSRHEVGTVDEYETAANAASRIRTIFSDATSTPSLIVPLVNQQDPSRVSSGNELQQPEPSPSSVSSPLSPIRSASSEILRAFSERENRVTTGVDGSNNPESNSASEITNPVVVVDAQLDALDELRLRTGEDTIHAAISEFRQRLDRAITDSGLRSNTSPTAGQETATTRLQNMVSYDADHYDAVVDLTDILSSSRRRRVAANVASTLTTDAQRPNNSSGSGNNSMNTATTGLLALEDQSLDGRHSSSVQRSRRRRSDTSRLNNEERPSERRILHRLRESRRRAERTHRESSGNHHGRGRETTITISFSRGDQDRSVGSGVGEGTQPENLSLDPPSASPAATGTRDLTSLVSGLEIPSSLPLPIIMDCDSDTASDPSTSASRRENTVVPSETQVTGGNSAVVSGYNSAAVDDDIEILFSDIEDADVN